MTTTSAAARVKRMVVDDDLEAALLLSLTLRRMGHFVLTANNGADVLAWAANGFPEVVLLDLEMADLDGYQTCRLVRSTEWGANALIVGGHGTWGG